ncbi:MAG TPA: tol-pal system protein YbgF [Burkholderiales bacterium]|nr:tol-pal system protein YbgF [Burkholderiales bacterium]
MRFSVLFSAALVAAAAGCAGLTTDDEARRRIDQQQQQIVELQTQNHALETRVMRLEQAAKNQGLLDLLTQIQALKVDLDKLRGQIEVQANDIESIEKRQKDFYVDLDTRLRRLEQSSQTLAPAPETGGAKPGKPGGANAETETKSYETAYNLFKAGNYAGAVTAFQNFIKEYPSSNLASSAQYWIGNAYFAQRDFKNAIASQQKLLDVYPDSSKAPDAMLNIASSQQELGNDTAAKKTLKELIAKYPVSDAADKAKKRLSAIK